MLLSIDPVVYEVIQRGVVVETHQTQAAAKVAVDGMKGIGTSVVIMRAVTINGATTKTQIFPRINHNMRAAEERNKQIT